MSKEAMKLALEALENSGTDMHDIVQYQFEIRAIKALEAALAKQEQGEPDDLMIAYMSGLHDGKKLAKKEQGEPVAWMKEQWSPDCGTYFEIYRDDEMGWRDRKDWTPLYTTPQQCKPLTDEQILELNFDGEFCTLCDDDEAILNFARAIEAAHGIKE